MSSGVHWNELTIALKLKGRNPMHDTPGSTSRALQCMQRSSTLTSTYVKKENPPAQPVLRKEGMNKL